MPRKESGDYVADEMRSYKHGNKRIKNRKQAIAIGLNKARKAGKKVAKLTPNKKKTKSHSRTRYTGRSKKAA